MKKKKNDNNIIEEKETSENDKLLTKSCNQLTVVSNQGYDLVSTTIPNNFFEGLLIREMELNNEFTMEKLFDLVSQYSLAIEFYLQIDPIKAKAYQNRMEYLLTNKDTLAQLSKHKFCKKGKQDKQNESNEKNQNPKNKVKNNKDFNQSRYYVKLKQKGLKYKDISHEVNTVISKGKKDENKNVKNIINDDIKKQNESWKEKFNNKKKVSLRNSFRTTLGLSLTKRKSEDFSLDLKKPSYSQNFFVNKGNNEFGSKKTIEELNEINEEEKNLEYNNGEIKIEKGKKEEEKEEKKPENKEAVKEENSKERDDNEKKEETKKDEKNKEEKAHEKEKIENEVKEIQNKEALDKEFPKKEENDKNDDKKDEEKEENNLEKKENNEKEKENYEGIKKYNEEKKDNNEIKINEDKNGEENSTDIESIIYKIMKEQEEEEEDKEEKEKKEKLKKDNSKPENEILEGKPENKLNDNIEQKDILPIKNRASIVDEDLIRKIEPDEEISKSIEEQILSLKKIIDNLNKHKNKSENDKENEEGESSQNEEENKYSDFSNSNSNLNEVSKKSDDEEQGLLYSNFDDIPAKFMSTYYQIESFMIEYMNNFNECYYKDAFEQFSSGLKELYESKYNKYIEIRNEYHNQIKEKEYLLENDENLNEEKKLEIQQTIDSLNEEQQHQIETVEDEFNRKIIEKISEFKLNSFKNNSGIQLLEEQLKLNIYSLINDSLY